MHPDVERYFTAELSHIADAVLEKLGMPIHVVTGRSGAGKTTFAKRLKGYDLKVSTDTGGPDGKGGYVTHPPEVRDRIRNEKLGKILKADARGKNVLVEGGPGAVQKIFGPHIGRVDQVTELDTPVRESMRGVRRRALERLSNPREDRRTALLYNRWYRTDMAELVKKVKKVTKVSRTKLAYKATATSRAKTEAQRHFESPEPNWKAFEKNLKLKSFQDVVAKDPRADEKLKTYIENYGGYLRSKKVTAKVTSPDTGNHYIIKELPGGRLGCSCGNWQYRKSVDGGDCKHIESLVMKKLSFAEQVKQAFAKSLLSSAVSSSNLGVNKVRASRAKREADQSQSASAQLAAMAREAKLRGL